MQNPIRQDSGHGNHEAARDGQTDTPSLLTQALRFAVGMSMLPLIGFGLLGHPASTHENDGPEPASPPLRPSPPRGDEPPSQADVEAALRKLTAATLPRNPPRSAPRLSSGETEADRPRKRVRR